VGPVIAGSAGAVERMRTLLAFALTTCEAEGVEPWSVEVTHDGNDLRIGLGDSGTPERADRLAAALGVADLHTRWQSDRTIYTAGSKLPRPSWAKPEAPDYFGASVPFDDRLIEVTVTCYGLRADE
jgi:hypothetical protein